MRILVIAPEQLPVPPIKGGSVESCIYNTFTQMAKTDHITIISRAHPRLANQSSELNGRLKHIRIPQANSQAYLEAAIKRIKGKTFDTIQIENRPTFVPLIRKAFPYKPIVLFLHSLTFMSKLTNTKACNILRKVNLIISVVDFVTNTMRKRFPKFSSKFKTSILGVDTKKFHPWTKEAKTKLRKHWNLTGSYNVLFVGRIISRKGLHTLVKAVAILRARRIPVRLIAIGASWPGVKKQTPYMRKVKALAANLKVPIYFTGYITPAHIHKMYQLGNVFVCPTQFQEGFATVNSEAMASGIPVIASNRGGIREVIKNGQSGLLVDDYKNPAAFAKAILKLKSSPQLEKRLIEGGRKRVIANFSWATTAQKLNILYGQCKKSFQLYS